MAHLDIKDSILVKMLSVLSPKQRKGFKAYLGCDLFNTNVTLRNLYAYLLNKSLSSPETVLLQADLVKDLGISERIVDKLFSQMLQQLNRFAHFWHKRNHPHAEYPGAFHFWMEQDLDVDLLEREYRKMKRKMETAPLSGQGLLNQLHLEHHYAVFQTLQPRKDQQNLFQRHHALLDAYYWITKLKYLCASANAAQIIRQSASQLASEIKIPDMESLPPLGHAYFQAYHLLRDGSPSLERAGQLFALLEENGTAFPEEDRLNLYGFLLNTCALRVGAGKVPFENLALKTYDSALEDGFLIQQGKISAAHFKNIVSLKLRCGTPDTAKLFIETYKTCLPAPDRKVLLLHCDGLVSFFSGDFHAALLQFQAIIQNAPEDMYWGLEARNMLWKTYFEIGEQLNFSEKEKMLRLYDSFRLYVSRHNRISEQNKTRYENFIRIFNQLIRTNDRGKWITTKEEYQTILEEAKSADALMNKNWLIEAIERKIAAF